MKKVAIIGVGRMGVNHVRVISRIRNVLLQCLCDKDMTKLRSDGNQEKELRVYSTYQYMLDKEKLDAVIIATPTDTHYEVAKYCLERDLHVFVEKPLAATVSDCYQLIEVAKKYNKSLFVGHVERFNPVTEEIKKRVSELGTLYYVETERVGFYPKVVRGKSRGVVFDLAVHDLDLISYLIGEPYGFATHLVRLNEEDVFAKVMYQVKDISCCSTFSWISPKKSRTIYVYGENGVLKGDFLNQEVWFYEMKGPIVETGNYYRDSQISRGYAGRVIRFPIKKEEPLEKELQTFFEVLGKNKDYYTYGVNAVDYVYKAYSSVWR